MLISCQLKLLTYTYISISVNNSEYISVCPFYRLYLLYIKYLQYIRYKTKCAQCYICLYKNESVKTVVALLCQLFSRVEAYKAVVNY